MQLSEHRSTRPAISLTPMIDVVFLLIIFFMLTSTFLKFNAIPISAVQTGRMASDGSEVVRIQIFDGQRLEVDGAVVPLDGLSRHLDTLIGVGMTGAVIKTGPGATVQDLATVLTQARRSRLKTVAIAR